MASSTKSRFGIAQPQGWGWVLNAFILTTGLFAVHCARAALAASYLGARNAQETYALPKPEHVLVLSLGYRSALADLLFAHTLVSSGIHLAEKRRFETAADYLRTINELDPKFATPYRFADTILTVQATKPRLVDYESARSILERGMRELPYDTRLWLSAGQFMAYLAPPNIEPLAGAAAAKEWRDQGVRCLVRSCELVGKDENAPHHCVSATRLLTQAGELDALKQFVERVVAVNDDPEIRAQALSSLSRALGDAERQRLQTRFERYDLLRQRGLAFLGKDRFLVVGPGYDSFRCLDDVKSTQAECATTFAEYHRRLDEQQSE